MPSTPKKKWVKLERGHDDQWRPVCDAEGNVVTCDYADSAGMIVAQFPWTMVIEEKHYPVIQDHHAKAKALPYAQRRVAELKGEVAELHADIAELKEKLKYFQLPDRC